VVDAWPVLVDFDHSILCEGEVHARVGGSAIVRREFRGFAKRLKELIVPPNYVARRNVARMLTLLRKLNFDPIILVIGGGVVGNGMEAFYEDDSVRIIGTDIYGSSLTQFIADGHQIPLADASVNAVLIQAVLEHVLTPTQVVAEIHRVLKPDGLVYAETPFLQQVHEGPYDFTRFTESGHRYLFKHFERVDSGKVGGPGTQLIWTLEYVSRSLFRSTKVGKLVKILFFWLCWLDRLIPARFAIDSAPGVFFLGCRAEREVTPHEMVAHYRGAQRLLNNRPAKSQD
jgi:SAM-dependent methyltransferase